MTPLVLISGLLSDASLWKHQADHLREIAPVYTFSSDLGVEEILAKAPAHFSLAGHSLGGHLALEILRKAPSRVTRLCLLNTTARPDSDEKKTNRKRLIQEAENGRFAHVVQELSSHFTFRKEIKPLVAEMFAKVGKETFVRQEKAMLAREEIASLLPKISCPTLILHAAQDANFSFQEQQELLFIPHSKLAVVEDSGHMSPLEMPQAVTALLRFWITYF